MGCVKEFCRRNASFLTSSVSLFDLKARFFVPTRPSLTAARAGAVKVGRRTNLSACSALARPCLDGLEHDGTLDAIGTDDQRELAPTAALALPLPARASRPAADQASRRCASRRRREPPMPRATG